MKEFKYFTYDELVRSNTADLLHIDNTPTGETLENMEYTMGKLDEIREGYGKPIILTSGYRCLKLNEAVGGVKDSYHTKGLAVDIKWDEALINYIIENHTFDKLIREKSKTSHWIHLQFRRNEKENRNITLSLTVNK